MRETTLAVPLLLLSGCFLAPGMTTDEGSAVARGRETTRDGNFDVQPITPHPELTTPTGQFRSPEENGNRVGADGMVYYPDVGVVQVAGKTVTEIRSLLTERLRTVMANPQLDVRVAAFRGRRMQVTGEVVRPATVAITDVPLRVQDAIALAGGFAPEADWSNVTLTRAGRTFRLDLQALYEGGDLSQNWLIRDGDIVQRSHP